MQRHVKVGVVARRFTLRQYTEERAFRNNELSAHYLERPSRMCFYLQNTAAFSIQSAEYSINGRRAVLVFVSRLQPPHYLLSGPSLFLGKS